MTMLGRLTQSLGEKNGESGEPSRTSKDEDEEKIANIQEFQKEVDRIKKTIETIKERACELENLHQQSLDESSTGEGEISKVIEKVINETNGSSVDTRMALKRLSDDNERIASLLSPGHPFARLRGAQYTQVSQSFLAAMETYQNIQVKYKRKYQERLQRQFKVVRPEATGEELNMLLDEGGATMLRKQVRAQHKDIMLIEKSIVELHQLFLEMRTLIEEQGEQVNKIEDYVNQAANYTNLATAELKSAVHHQRSRWKKRWIFAILVTILLIVLGLWIYQQFFRSGYYNRYI